MATITRAQITRELYPGIATRVGLQYKEYAPFHLKMFDKFTSEKSDEYDVMMGGFGAAQEKPEGSGVQYAVAGERWTQPYHHITVALGFSITQEAIEDNLYESMAKSHTQMLARSFNQAKQVRAASIYNNGFNSAFPLADGQPVFSTAHQTIGGVNSNRPATGVDLNETAVENAIIQMSRWTDQAGIIIDAQPLGLMVPPELKFTATRILKTPLRPMSMNNDINALKDTDSLRDGMTVVNPYFTDPNAWFLRTDVPNGPKYWERRALKQDHDVDFDTSNMRFQMSERYSFGVTDPIGVWGSPGAF